jgi:serine/threonine protein kinase
MPARAGQRIGPYVLIRELGRGGMGVVYLAARADHAFDKQVAIKLVRGLFADPYLAERFRDERQILANLNHPGVAHLLDGGTTGEGAPYLVMEYVEGVPIDEYCATHALDTRRRLDLFRQVCDAVHYAHRNLVIHRDLKPSNILVTAAGTPKLLDFGIAKLPRVDVLATETLRSFTPDYASPEQVRGEPITTGSDVYSLGVLLYHLLTGRSPYRSTGDRARARPHDLRGCANCARHSGARPRHDRVEGAPQGAGAPLQLGRAAVDRHRPLSRRPAGTRRARHARLSRCEVRRRHALGVAAAAALFLVLAGATAVTTWQARVANRERARAEHRFNEVRQLATSVVGELHDAIRDLSGATAARSSW